MEQTKQRIPVEKVTRNRYGFPEADRPSPWDLWPEIVLLLFGSLAVWFL